VTATASSATASLGTVAPSAAAARREVLRDLTRSVAGPLICGIVLLGLLTAWVVTGGAGTLTQIRLQITLAAVPERGVTPQTATGAASTFLTIKNLTSTPDELLSVTSPIASRIVLTEQAGPGAPQMVVSDLVIPAEAELFLSPLGDDIVLQNPAFYEYQATVPLTLRFRHAGTVTIDAAVTLPGTP
jgi:copper(I)-binding protein